MLKYSKAERGKRPRLISANRWWSVVTFSNPTSSKTLLISSHSAHEAPAAVRSSCHSALRCFTADKGNPTACRQDVALGVHFKELQPNLSLTCSAQASVAAAAQQHPARMAVSRSVGPCLRRNTHIVNAAVHLLIVPI